MIRAQQNSVRQRFMDFACVLFRVGKSPILLMLSTLAATAMTLFSCVPQERGQFAPPTVVSVSSEIDGREALVLSCELSDSRVESCGFIYSADGIEQRVECTLENKSFEARLTGLAQGVVYSWCAYYSAGGTELRSDSGTFRLTADTDPIPVEDPAFKAWLVEHYDNDRDGVISFWEAEWITEVRITPSNQYNLQSLKGIEFMPNLEVIDCRGEWYDIGDKSTGVKREHYFVGPYQNYWPTYWGPIGTLKYVDVSNNPKLKELYLNNNSALGIEIESLDLSNNPKIKILDISYTWLNFPDIAQNIELREILFCHLRGKLPDFSRISKAVRINLDFPRDFEPVSFDVSGMPDLEVLELRGMVRSLSDLSANKKLRYLSIAHCNYFTGSLNLSECPDLEGLQCMCSNLYSLNLSNNSKLRELYCDENHLTELDLSKNPLLEKLDCRDNQISALDVSSNPLLNSLSCAQQNRPDGTNYLQTLYVSAGQQIPYVTSDRDASHIPEETEIIELAPYSLGDIVESDAPGIVAVVFDGGREALLMSVTEIHNRPWEESDEWCRSYGQGWRMPTIDELDAIQPNFDFLNGKLRAAGYTPLTSENKCYWSCTPYELVPGYYYREKLCTGNIWYYGSDEWHGCYANYTRAVKTISF